MRDLLDLTAKVAIVTGGNGGIGRAIALGLAQHGADIVVAARNEHKTAPVVSEVEAMGRRGIGVPRATRPTSPARRACGT